jgi:hypothetical protein
MVDTTPSTNASLLGGDFDSNRLQSTSNPLDTANTGNIFSSAAAQLEPLRQSIGYQTERIAYELRITKLEASLAQLLNEQRQNSRGYEPDVSTQHQSRRESVRLPVDTHVNTYAHAHHREILTVFQSDNHAPAQAGDDRVNTAASTSYYTRNLTG